MSVDPSDNKSLEAILEAVEAAEALKKLGAFQGTNPEVPGSNPIIGKTAFDILIIRDVGSNPS